MPNTLINRPRPTDYTLEKATPHGVVFYSETPVPRAIAYRGKSGKRSWHYRFPSSDRLHATIDEFLSDLATRAAAMAERKKNRLDIDATAHFTVGDIVYNTWGYDQTNADFYEVLAVTPRSLMLRELASHTTETGFMSGNAIPIPGKYTPQSAPERHFVRPGYSGGKPVVNFQFGCGSKWDGRPVGCSWYA